ncbi:MAG: murein biosynthesis integral membrane protein MurJ [Deltaproteobacteria bacterium]|nr:murein biosynthesis integral membrane protein MurJ [Deltaproteobacteria bacterium]
MSLFRSGFLFALGTMISRLSGLLRESVIAGVFGASVSMDAFLVANRIPNMLRELFAEGALGSSFTKVFSELWEQDPERARRLLWDTLLFSVCASILICLAGISGASWLVDMMTLIDSDKSVQEQRLFISQARGLTALLFPFIGFMMTASVAGGALHQKGRFLLSSLSPIALNCGYLLGALVFARLLEDFGPNWIKLYFADQAITGLALGVLFGGGLQLALQLGGLWKPLIAPWSFPGFSSFCGWSHDVRKVLRLMGPMVIAAGAGQINVLINTNFATSLGTGAVTWLGFAFRLLQLPIGIFAVAVSAAALPSFSRLLSRKNMENLKILSDQLVLSSGTVLWLMSACFCVIAVSGQDIIRLLFEQGAFLASDTKATSSALYYYSFGLMGYGLIKVLSAYYYASDRTSWAMKVSLLSIGSNFILNYLLVDTYGADGLAMTASAVLTFNAIALCWGLRKDQLPLNHKMIAKGILALLCSLTLSLIASTGVRHLFFPLIDSLPCHFKMISLIRLGISGILVALIFSLTGWSFLGYRPDRLLQKLRQGHS